MGAGISEREVRCAPYLHQYPDPTVRDWLAPNSPASKVLVALAPSKATYGSPRALGSTRSAIAGRQRKAGAHITTTAEHTPRASCWEPLVARLAAAPASEPAGGIAHSAQVCPALACCPAPASLQTGRAHGWLRGGLLRARAQEAPRAAGCAAACSPRSRSWAWPTPEMAQLQTQPSSRP